MKRARDLLAPLPRLGRDALERIRAAAAHRTWTCLLRPAHVRDVAAQLDAWTEMLGLPGPAAGRIRRAAKSNRGARLSVEECRAIAEAALRIDLDLPADRDMS